MRITMDKFMSKLAAGYPMIMSRGENEADILKYKNEFLPMFEAICAQSPGKFLFGTDELTMLDIHCAPFLEFFYIWDRGIY